MVKLKKKLRPTPANGRIGFRPTRDCSETSSALSLPHFHTLFSRLSSRSRLFHHWPCVELIKLVKIDYKFNPMMVKMAVGALPSSDTVSTSKTGVR